jgi:hypothetical protein
MSDSTPTPPSERTRVEQLLVRLIQGQDAELERLDGIRRAIDWAPLYMGCVLISIEIVAWILRAMSAR